ncbi:MAG: hypothetical protein ACREBS_10075 [Nitrososphaerales archaeon]
MRNSKRLIFPKPLFNFGARKKQAITLGVQVMVRELGSEDTARKEIRNEVQAVGT